ncbi:sigma-54-dependent Fis family transcriptional regulator [Proteinivorax hydrogeniformans]|uniref:Sigma-54-dependent Fis family transcriptional regulator n=1 Tax=Proteinivorax hydrogeniformans TaxID=1826727 RepID=A0AAU8HQF6_9FIRM
MSQKKIMGPNEILGILDSIKDAIMAIDLEGKIILMNKGAEKIVKVDADKAIGREVTEVVPTSKLKRVLREGKGELNKRQVIGNSTILTNRMPVLNQQGELVGAVAVFRDITEVIELAEEATNLKEIQGMLEAIINATEDAISVVDKHGKGLVINPAYKKLTGFTEEDILGQPATVDISQGESVHLKVLKTRKPIKGEKLKVGPQEKEVLVDAAPVIVNDELKGSVAVIHDISEIKRLNYELDKAKRIIRKLEAKYTFEDIIAKETNMKMAIAQAENAAVTPATVLLRGESGTGKEIFAHAIHNASNRRFNQFIRVNCAALPESLLESELFGYVEGAFTGAKRGGKKGIFAQANGGTIFLDEIGEISLNIQAKLLRVLQEREIVPVGESKPQNVDVRIIAATNVNLEEAIKKGAFREDLYYRISVVPIFIPPLRERIQEIEPLSKHILKKFNQDYGRNIEGITSKAIERLSQYKFRGNVRELENIIGRAIINMDFSETLLDDNHLPHLDGTTPSSLKRVVNDKRHLSLDEVIAATEKDYILKILRNNNNNKTQTAKDLKVSIRTLYNKLEKYNVQ